MIYRLWLQKNIFSEIRVLELEEVKMPPFYKFRSFFSVFSAAVFFGWHRGTENTGERNSNKW